MLYLFMIRRWGQVESKINALRIGQVLNVIILYIIDMSCMWWSIGLKLVITNRETMYKIVDKKDNIIFNCK